MPRKLPKAPTCQHCPDSEAVLVPGSRIYPRRGDLAALWFWYCADCGAVAACHKGTKKAVGRPANSELRTAREKLQRQRLDPVWTRALEAVDYQIDHRDIVARKMALNAARKRTYAWVAEQVGLPEGEAHLAMFDLEQCRLAWRALGGVDYATIRDWHKSKEAAKALDKTNEEAARL